MAANARDWWTRRRLEMELPKSFMVPSPNERKISNLATIDHKLAGEGRGISSSSYDTHAGSPLQTSFYFSSNIVPRDFTGQRFPQNTSASFTSCEAVKTGLKAACKAAAVACIATAIPTLIGVRVVPWAKANLNYTAQALIICSATGAAYFIAADHTILECARSTSYAKIEADRASREPF